MAPSQPLAATVQGTTESPTMTDGALGTVSTSNSGTSVANGSTERVLVAEGNTRVSEVVTPDGQVTSVRASVQVEVNASGQVVFNDIQKQAFAIAGLGIGSISTGDGQARVSIADTGRGQDAPSYSAELGSGERLPAWIFVNSITGELTVRNPPAGIDVIIIRVKAAGSDGKVRMLEMELNLSDLLKRPGADQPPVIVDAVPSLSFVPLADQVAAEISMRDGYGQRLMALLEAA